MTTLHHNYRTAVLVAVLLAGALARPAGAVVLFSSDIGWSFGSSTDRIDTGYSLLGDRLEPTTAGVRGLKLSRHGALCPAAGTPNRLCAEAFASASLDGGRATLRVSTRLVRSMAQMPSAFTSDHVYADAQVGLYNLGVVGVAAPVANAYITFGLSGTVSKQASDPSVTTFAAGVARLDGQGIQCVGTVCEPIRMQNWTPNVLVLTLRSDVTVAAPPDLQFDAEVVADFADTFELLAIELRDENNQPIPGASVVVKDGNGNTVLTIPTAVASTTTTTTTATTTTGLGSTTTTLPEACPRAATFPSVTCRLAELTATVQADATALGPKLLARLTAASTALADAQAAQTDRKFAKALQRSRKAVGGFGKLLRSKAAQRLIPDPTRTTWREASAGVVEDIRTLASAPRPANASRRAG